ncbi:AAA family ATPase [Candidatus Synechococcus spongiarum]|uniref:Chromosome segregation protein SMC n=1 Tax=Candidatus Synechococcus spongiarum LMB bulk15N TaxID=1943583 RepID=A0A1T1CRD1_9SYNE|nr:AAA family ATPase [Candidatus Synechococcus spongiarum]OOV31165.1 chromosome segregation protein SMC [Candidatus Synechococcus spongiarum LMB bulk15N]
MQIERIRIRNFRAFRDVEMLHIPRLVTMVGANGTGKSSLFSVFGFLRDAMNTNVRTALVKLGGSRGFHEVRSRNCDGPIELEVAYRIRPRQPLVSYSVSINLDRSGKPIVEREILRYRRGEHGKPWHFLDFKRGKGYAVTNEVTEVKKAADLDREEQETLKSPDLLAIKGLAQFERFPAVVALGNLIERWHVSDFHISRARVEPEAGYAEHLSREGENLALVIEYLHDNHPKVFSTIKNALQKRVPGITQVESKQTEEGRVLLKFQDEAFADPFLARHVSDGTIKMLAYLTLLYDPDPHPLLCVEEPENQLYPTLLEELVEEFRAYAQKGGQVLISTHSPDFLNAAHLEEVFWLQKHGGYTTIHRASDNQQVAAYMADGGRMGHLWKQGFFKGVEPEG